MIYSLHPENLYTYILKTDAKTREKDLNNTNLVTKVKVENFYSQLKGHNTKELLTLTSVDIRISDNPLG